MAQPILTPKRLEELLSKDFELRRLMAIMTMLASMRMFAQNEIELKTERLTIPENIRMDASELGSILNLEEGLASLPNGSKPEDFEADDAGYWKRLREHRECLRELKHAVDIIAGHKPSSPRSIAAACERIRLTIDDIIVERREEVTSRLQRMALRHQAQGLSEDRVIHLMRLRLDLELTVSQTLASLRALQSQHAEAPAEFTNVERLGDIELNTLAEQAADALLELQTRPTHIRMEVA
ncbi:MAG: hypothetical protein U0487_01950 [Patescibacteria group bacterium]